MKKVSATIKEKSLYNLEDAYYDIDTAPATNAAGETGLINIRTGEVVGSFGRYDSTYYDDDSALLFQLNYYNDNTRIYDVLKEKMLADNWLEVYSGEISGKKIYILQDSSTGKYHLFCRENYRTSLNIFEEEFDEIKFLSCEYGESLFSVSIDGKKGLYSCQNGWVKSCEYDDIEQVGLLTIFTQGKNKFFFGFECDDDERKEIISPIFDEIKCDKNDERLIYCKKDSNITIYYVWGNCYKSFHFGKTLFNVPGCDDIKCLTKNGKSAYDFVIKQNNKYGLVRGFIGELKGPNPCQTLLDTEYDAIEYKDGDYYFTKDGKLGLLTGSSEIRGLIPPKYDKVKRIIDRTYYEVYNEDECSIIRATDGKSIVNCCKVINFESNARILIYEKDGKKGMVQFGYYDKISLLQGYDDVVPLGENRYLVIQNGKMGLFYKNKTIIKPIYESIEINGYRYPNIKDQNVFENSDDKILYMALQKPDGTYDVARFNVDKFRFCDIEDDIEQLKIWTDFNYVKLFRHIVVLKNKDNTFIYDYSGELLKTFPITTQIRATTMGDNCYLVDDNYYFYINKSFQKAYFEDADLYATAYESEYGTVVVNSFNQEEHDRVCDEIEKLDDQAFDDTLISLYEQNPSVKEKYPTLVKKL